MFRSFFVFTTLLLLTLGCGGTTPKAENPAPAANAPTTAELDTSKTNGAEEESVLGKQVAPGSRLSLWLPSGLERFGRALIYRNSASTLVVALAELTATEGEGPKLVSGVIGGAQGLTVTNDEKNGGFRKVLLSGKKTDREARLLVLESGGKAATVYVIFSPDYAKQADRILASASLDPTSSLDPLALHGITLGPLGNMTVGNMTHQPILLTRKDGGSNVSGSSLVAFVSINPHNYGDAITDEQLGGLVGATISNLQPDFESAKVNEVKVAGKQAQEFLLQGERDGKPLAIYTYAIPDGDCAIIAVAYVQMDRADAEMADVVPLLRSIKLGDI